MEPKRKNFQHHGTAKAKGCPHLRLGNFGKLFPKLSPRQLTDDEATLEARALGGVGSPMHDADFSSPDSGLPAGYTFLAQFIDHDITLDTATDLKGSPEPNVSELPNLRSPSLDLDCVYGFGPEANPHIYESSAAGRLMEGNSVNKNDLARNEEGRAQIGDPRNDENLFVSQLQLLFHRFHNRVLDSSLGDEHVEERFEEAQTKVRHHYQYLVVHDFLRRVCHPKIYEFALKKLAEDAFPLIYEPDAHHNLPMPVEFSVAAYRFGHTLVRSRYAANGKYPDIDLFEESFGTLGFSAVPPELTVDWRFLLPVDDCFHPLSSKRFDAQLADELIRLPNPVVGRRADADERSLAFRNLRRGHVLGLPDGQSVAGALNAAGYPILANFDLKFADIEGWNELDTRFGDHGEGRERIEKSTPLFFYILREADLASDGEQLGPVGSAILLEVFLGILVHCKTSYLDEESFELDPCIAPNAPSFELADIVRFVEGH